MKTTWTEDDRQERLRITRLRLMADQRLFLGCVEMLFDRAWTADCEKVLANRAAFEAYFAARGQQ